jgi:hypothetical protein
VHLGTLELLVVFLVLSLLLFAPELLESSIKQPLARFRWIITGLVIVLLLAALLGVRHVYHR